MGGLILFLLFVKYKISCAKNKISYPLATHRPFIFHYRHYNTIFGKINASTLLETFIGTNLISYNRTEMPAISTTPTEPHYKLSTYSSWIKPKASTIIHPNIRISK